jgi:hypothetical protein
MARNQCRNHFNCEPPRGNKIKLWERKLFTTGSLHDLPRSGRNKLPRNLEALNASLQAFPTKSVRKRSAQLQIPRSSLHTVLRKTIKVKPWRPTHVQFLTEADHASRVAACQALLNRYPSVAEQQLLFFSDECAVYCDAKAKNVVWWSKENPFFTDQVRQHPASVMIWGAISRNYLIGPFFLDGHVTAALYIQLLQRQFVPAIRNLPCDNLRLAAHLQQDGAPAHTALSTRTFLNNMFPNCWVGKFGPVPWPARSPDLTTCDNALWGIVKAHVLAGNAVTVNDIKVLVREAFVTINDDKQLLRKMSDRTWRRLQLCVDKNGLQVDPYD